MSKPRCNCTPPKVTYSKQVTVVQPFYQGGGNFNKCMYMLYAHRTKKRVRWLARCACGQLWGAAETLKGLRSWLLEHYNLPITKETQ